MSVYGSSVLKTCTICYERQDLVDVQRSTAAADAAASAATTSTRW